MRPVVLTVAGSDSSGGAGIQADLAAILRLGGHGASVVTAVTAQSTTRVTAVHPIPDAIVEAQLAAVLDDLPVAAVKTGMLATAAQARAVAAVVATRALPLVVDPVLIATSGDPLAGPDVMEALRTALLPLATLVTPNRTEAAALTGRTVEDVADMTAAGHALLETGAAAVLVTGGRLAGRALDVLVTPDRVWELAAAAVEGPPVHGTGCTLAAAIACRLAHGEALLDAVRAAKAWLTSAIEAAGPLGAGAPLLGAPTCHAVVTIRERSAPGRS